MADEGANIDYALVTKFLAGETTAEEHKAVSLWINASEGNRHAFARLKTTWEQSGRITPHEAADVDVDKAWRQFKNRIRPENNALPPEKTETKTRRLFHYLSRVAALLVIGIAGYFLYQSRQESPAVEEVLLGTSLQVVTDTLPDGSLVTLNAHSKVAFPPEFSGDKRPVSLRGEAFFNVVPDPQKPFVVQAGGIEVTVLGTSFGIKVYDSLQAITVGVREGQVKVAAAQAGIILNAGQRITIDRVSLDFGPVTAYNPNDMYWESNTLIFQREELADVFRTLEKIYQIEITTENANILDCRLTAKFYGENIQQILEIINTNFNLTATHEGNRFTIAGQGCQ